MTEHEKRSLQYRLARRFDLDPRRIMEIIREEIKKTPLTEEKPKGEWIAQDIHNCHTNFKCSKCGYIHNFMHLYGKPTADYTYCPNCGADMRGE